MMLQERNILHLNVADFGVAVERISDSSLAGRPVIIAPLQSARAVVYDMSDEAYHAGVRKGMLLNRAVKRCRGAHLLQPRVELYRKAMSGLIREVKNYSPQIEYGLEDGHLYVDITGTHRLWGPPPDIGMRIRREIRSGMGLDPIWTLGANRLVTKVASRLVKPVGEYIVAQGEEESFLAPLSVSLLPGLKREELRQLQDFRIRSIGQLADLSHRQLMVPFGSRSSYLYEASRGRDVSEIGKETEKQPVVEHEKLFAADTNDKREVEAAVADLAAHCGSELRRQKQAARRVGIWLCYSDGGHIVRQASTKSGTASDFVLHKLAMTALSRAWLRRTRLRTIRMSCDRIHRESPQLPLFPETVQGEKRQDRLLSAMDQIRARYGHGAIGHHTN